MSMHHLLIICAFSVSMLLGCQRPSKSPPPFANPQEKKYMQGKNQEGIADGTEVFFVLRNQELVPVQKQTPESFYIKGLIAEGEFVPKSGILGNGDLSTSGRYGWLELGSREFYPMESDKKASTPFVKGYQTPQGFVPSMREVFSEP